MLHRLAWFYMKGEWPDVIDHEDHDGYNNVFVNLKNGSHHDNMKNMSLHKTNKSGVSGVFWGKNVKKWCVQIWHNKKPKHVGVFEDFDDAVKARKAAEVDHGYHENHGKG